MNAHAQTSSTTRSAAIANKGLAQTARTATSAVGETGQQQARKDVSSTSQSGRISNRINNRINARLDRNYRVETSPASAVETAQARQRQR